MMLFRPFTGDKERAKVGPFQPVAFVSSTIYHIRRLHRLSDEHNLREFLWTSVLREQRFTVHDSVDIRIA